MQPGFQFSLLWYDQDVLGVHVSASNLKFSGTANVYEAIGGLAEAADKLEGFPRNPTDSRELEFGSFGPKTAGSAVSMRFYCKGGAVRTYVEASIESDHRCFPTAETVHLFAAVEPAAIDIFVSQLRDLKRNRQGVAELKITV